MFVSFKFLVFHWQSLVLRWRTWVVIGRWTFIFRSWWCDWWVLISWWAAIPVPLFCKHMGRGETWKVNKMHKWMCNECNWSTLTLGPCHCSGPRVIHCHYGVRDVVNQSPHNSQHGDHVMKHDDHVFAACFLGHCLNNWKIKQNFTY